MVIKETWLLHLVTAGLVLNLTMIGWQLAHLSAQPENPAKESEAREKTRKKLLAKPQTEHALAYNSNFAGSPAGTKRAAIAVTEPSSGIKGPACLDGRCSEPAQIEAARGINRITHPAVWVEQNHLTGRSGSRPARQ